MHSHQAIIRLQMLQAIIVEIHSLRPPQRHPLRAIIPTLRLVAEAADENELTGYALVCHRVVEKLETRVESRGTPLGLLSRIAAWAAASELYLRRTQCRQFARMVVLQFNDPLWGFSIDHSEQVLWIDALVSRSRPPRLRNAHAQAGATAGAADQLS